MPPLITIKNLTKNFPYKKTQLRALSEINLTINQGETLGLVGESGSGKSTLGKLILRLQECTSGEVFFKDKNIFSLPPHLLKSWRQNAQMIFQDPYSSLNPRMRAEEIISEPFYIHNIPITEGQLDELFLQVGLDPSFRSRFPHEFSSGQRQRLSIGRALALKPHFLVCDEPLSALDVSIQAQIAALLKDLQQRLGLTYLFITHDLRMVKVISHRIAVLYLGHIVELSPSSDLYKTPYHPYTEALLSAIPTFEKKKTRIMLKGEPPSPLNPPKGCPFASRCSKVQSLCNQINPPLRELSPGHYAACHFPNGDVPCQQA